MNVRFRWQATTIASVTGAAVLLLGCVQAATAQMSPSNPLRPTRQAVRQPAAAAPVSAVQPIRATVQSEEVRQVSAQARLPKSQTVHRPVSYGKPNTTGIRTAQRATPGFVPRHARTSYMQVPHEAEGVPTEVIEPGTQVMSEPGDMMLDPLPAEGEYMDSGCCDDAASDCGDCGGCSSCSGCGSCGGVYNSCGCLIPCPRLSFDNFEFFAGTQGFTAPLNRGETGSFGFHYGFNWGAPVPCLFKQPIGVQLGYRGVSTNYSGTSFSGDSRNQSFFTLGLFRRVDWGLQGGIVVDGLVEDWYYDKMELTQLRGELSWVYPQCHELGFWFTTGTKNRQVESVILSGQRTAVVEEYEPTDLLAFFYRRRFDEIGGGYGRIFAGFTGNSEGLLGVDFKLPLTASLALQSEFTYLIPKDGNNQIAHLEEAWNVGISLVWYPGRRKAYGKDYFRPLLDVADNGDFIARPVGLSW